MDSRWIALNLSIKGLSAKAFHQKLVQTLGAEANVYRTVMWSFCAAKFPAQNREARHMAGVTRTDSVGADSPKALTDNPFSSVPESSRLTCLPRSNVHRRLTVSLGFTVCHLHWILHRLSDDQKTIRVNLF
jgi:hypothetical protein